VTKPDAQSADHYPAAGQYADCQDQHVEPPGAIKLAALVAVEPATKALLSTWLGECRWRVADLDQLDASPQLIIVEVSFPRAGPRPELPSLSQGFPGVPIVVVSPTIVAATPSRGDVARQLGVSAVLAIPLSRSTLLATVRELTSSDP